MNGSDECKGTSHISNDGVDIDVRSKGKLISGSRIDIEAFLEC